jgi:gamma-D-glutamyl-L-lysine dipeptidyl-peptidase
VAVRDEPDPQDPHGYPGWLPTRQLKPAFDDSGPAVVVRARTATVRVAGKTIALSYGTRLPVVSGNHVRTPDGEGVVSGAAAPLAPTNASIIAQGKRFLGVHYLWGGLSAWGYDCSGLIWALYREHGLTIPRDADPQMHHGTPVARDALRPGDLLFFGSPGYADHVTIYLGGDRQLEAPDSAHRVRISPVRWAHYIGARRYLSR